MKLTIINASPRGKHSNSNTIAKWYIDHLSDEINIDLFHAYMLKDHDKFIASLTNNQTILIIFPLYTDSIPYVLKVLIEKLDLVKDDLNGIQIYFTTHSGFMGGKHCRAIESYLSYVSNYMGFQYMGTAIRPSSEGFRMFPDIMINKPRKLFRILANDIKDGKPFNQKTLDKLIPFETPSFILRQFFKLGIGYKYFNDLLKENNSYDKRLNRPYKSINL